MCDFNCLECVYGDCVNDAPATDKERKEIIERDKETSKVTGIDMTRYIHNRIDKEEYVRERNKEYEKKRQGSPKRIEAKRQQYLRHRSAKLDYQNKYYYEHKEEILARQKAHYQAHREEINARRREKRKNAKGGVLSVS